MKNFNLRIFITLAVFFYFLTVLASASYSQEDKRFEQLWLTGELIYPVKVGLLIKSKVGYRSVYNSGERWRAGNISGEIDYALLPTIDLIGSIRGLYSNQNDTLSRTELRSTIGLKIDLLRRGRFIIKDYVRYEWRQFFYNFSELNQGTSRLRNRVSLTFAINKKQPSIVHALNLILSYEAFIIRDDDLEDRFDNTRRIQAGLSYRFNENWRMDVSYFRQNSRNQIGEPFDTRQNILEVKGIYSL